MVDTIQPRSTWSKVTSSAPVKKIDRRRDRKEEEKFQEHLKEKDASSRKEENPETDPRAADATATTEKETADSGTTTKPGKRIDIIV